MIQYIQMQPENKNQPPMNPENKNEPSVAGDYQYSYKPPLDDENESKLANFSILMSQLLLIDIILFIIVVFTMGESAWIFGMLLFWPGVLIFGLNIVMFIIHFVQSRRSGEPVNKKAKRMLLITLSAIILFLVIGNALET